MTGGEVGRTDETCSGSPAETIGGSIRGAGRTLRRRANSQPPMPPAASAAASAAAQGHQPGSHGCGARSAGGIAATGRAAIGPGVRPGRAAGAPSVADGRVPCGGAGALTGGALVARGAGLVVSPARTTGAGVGRDVALAAGVGLGAGLCSGPGVGAGVGISRGPIGTPARTSAGPWTEGVGVAPGGRLKSCGRSCAASGVAASATARAERQRDKRSVMASLGGEAGAALNRHLTRARPASLLRPASLRGNSAA